MIFLLLNYFNYDMVLLTNEIVSGVSDYEYRK